MKMSLPSQMGKPEQDGDVDGDSYRPPATHQDLPPQRWLIHDMPTYRRRCGNLDPPLLSLDAPSMMKLIMFGSRAMSQRLLLRPCL